MPRGPEAAEPDIGDDHDDEHDADEGDVERARHADQDEADLDGRKQKRADDAAPDGARAAEQDVPPNTAAVMASSS